jgi:hypothetical protein
LCRLLPRHFCVTQTQSLSDFLPASHSTTSLVRIDLHSQLIRAQREEFNKGYDEATSLD